MKIHLCDLDEDMKVPYHDENKKLGYRMAKCGFQREHTTENIEKVTCKICIWEDRRRKRTFKIDNR